jgi:hypothetical protein
MKRPWKEETMKRKRRKQVGSRDNQGVRKQKTGWQEPLFLRNDFLASISG